MLNGQNNKEIIFRFEADLDSAHTKTIQPILDKLLDQPSDHVILDFSEVNFIDSTGIGAIVFLFKRLSSQKRKLSLLKVSGQPHKLMTMLRVHKAIPFIEK